MEIIFLSRYDRLNFVLLVVIISELKLEDKIREMCLDALRQKHNLNTFMMRFIMQICESSTKKIKIKTRKLM